jgi:hypothetical protein
MARARQRYRRIDRHHPQRLDLAALDRLEHRHRLVAFALRHGARAPEATDAVDVGGREVHVRRKLIGEPADLAPAHGIGLAGERERPHARPADTASGEMAVDDGRDLVGALRRLVDALRIERDDARRIPEHLEEVGDVLLGQARRQCGRGDAAGDAAGSREGVFEATGVAFDVVEIERAGVGEMDQQPREQRGVGAGL